MNYYNINTALFNYVSLRASSTVGFPGLHFVMPKVLNFSFFLCDRTIIHQESLRIFRFRENVAYFVRLHKSGGMIPCIYTLALSLPCWIFQSETFNRRFPKLNF